MPITNNTKICIESISTPLSNKCLSKIIKNEITCLIEQNMVNKVRFERKKNSN